MGGIFDYWWLVNCMPERAYDDVMDALMAESEAVAIQRIRSKGRRPT